MAKTNHFLIQQHQLENILGLDKAKALINGNINPESLNKICEDLKLEKVGVFKVNNLDNINEKIWLVSSGLNVRIEATEAVFSRGFSQDKRDVLGMNLLILLLESILFISLIAVFDEKIIKFIRTKKLSH